MLPLQTKLVSLTTISEEVLKNNSGILYEFDHLKSLTRIVYYGQSYTLVIEFLKNKYEAWFIIQREGTETFMVWNHVPYQHWCKGTKISLCANDQILVQCPMRSILEVVKQTKASI